MLMGSKKLWHLIWVMLLFLHHVSSSIVHGKNESCNPNLLDDFIHEYVIHMVRTPRTSILHSIYLPSNFSGMEVSFVRLRSRTFYLHGANYSSFRIPPALIPRPFKPRIDLVYQNLGNWSSCYYNVANHTLVTPVVAVMVYDATSEKVGNDLTFEFRANADPILVHFPHVSIPNETAKCARFDRNGSVVEITNVTSSYGCAVRSHGHFAIMVPTPPPMPPPTLPPNPPPMLPPTPTPESATRERRWERWVIGFGAGIGGLILVIGLGFLLYKVLKRKRIGKMEREAERSEALDTMWIGRSRMPSATGIRTQPVIENEYVP